MVPDYPVCVGFSSGDAGPVIGTALMASDPVYSFVLPEMLGFFQLHATSCRAHKSTA
jgi:hypothetical protein